MWNGAYLLGSFIGPSAYGFIIDSIGFRSATVTFLPILVVTLLGNIYSLLVELVKRRQKEAIVSYQGIPSNINDDEEAVHLI